MDRDSSAPSTARFAGCLHVVPLLRTLMVGSTRATPHRYTASTARRRDILEVPAVLGGSALRGVRERAARRCESKPTAALLSAGGSHSSARRASTYTHRYRCRSSRSPTVPSVCTSEETQTLEARSDTPLVPADASRGTRRAIPACVCQETGTSWLQPVSLIARAWRC
jgi:hypothetical protein